MDAYYENFELLVELRNLLLRRAEFRFCALFGRSSENSESGPPYQLDNPYFCVAC